MANYGALKTMRGAAVGTIMPWTGSLTDIPPGWIICDGTSKVASEYPLLAQVIGDTYGGSTGFSLASFPWTNDTNTTFTLPQIDQRALADIDSSYFGSGAIDANIDTSEALSAVGTYIGTDVGNGTNFVDDAYTDILFSYTPQNDFSAGISGMTLNAGFGLKTVYTAPRKLGRRHIPIHAHPTEIPTILGNDTAKPGSGASCSREITYQFEKSAIDDVADEAQIAVEQQLPPASGGFGNGSDGIILANFNAEAPGPNLKPRNTTSHGISNWIGRMDDPEPPDPFGQPNNNPAHTRKFNARDTAPYGIGGTNIDTEHVNYDDGDVNTGDGTNSDRHRPYEVFFNHSGNSFNKTAAPTGVQDRIDAHDHSSFNVELDRANTSLRMPGLITVNDVQAQVTPDNLPQALNIAVTVPTPKLTVVYVIRAY